MAVYPESVSPQLPQHARDLLARYIAARNFAHDLRPLQGPGFVGLDIGVDADDATIQSVVQAFVREWLDASSFHPDAWPPVVIRAPQEAEARLAPVASDKYT